MSINVEQVAAVCASTAIVATMFGGLFAWIGRRMARKVAAAAKAVTDEASVVLTTTLIDRMDASDEAMKGEIGDLKKRSEEDRLEMAKQFGGNSGGIRQAIDGVASTVNQTDVKVANLEGRFEQHLKESGA